MLVIARRAVYLTLAEVPSPANRRKTETSADLENEANKLLVIHLTHNP